jgi:Fur family transcriptional regulator, ferric uptake regulator
VIAATQSNHPLAAVLGARLAEAAVTDACSRIRTAGMRVTKPRVALVETLLKLDGPVSIERIHQQVGIKSCDLVTIYRCLAAFENLGLVRRSYLHNGTCLYEQTLGTARHYHIVCKACGKTDKVDYTLAEGVEQKLQERGYANISHVVEFFGTCPACQQAAKSARGLSAPAIPSDHD